VPNRWFGDPELTYASPATLTVPARSTAGAPSAAASARKPGTLLMVVLLASGPRSGRTLDQE
jgi:hypothetical protein